jgi:small-conductance mechanosensitive channel
MLKILSITSGYNMKELLNTNFLGNTYYDYLVVLITFLGGIIAIFLFKKIIMIKLKRWANKSETTLDDLLVVELERTLLPILLFACFYFSIKTLALSHKIVTGLDILSQILLTFLLARLIVSLINHLMKSYLKRYDDFELRQKQMKGINILMNFIIWIIALIFLLDNLGIKITSIVAGLGIGGIAIALAAQAILGDLFSYFVIFFDRPFMVGDFIIVGDKVGAVEYIGIKTTRIRAISGEQLVFSNTDLTNSRVHNFKKMERRRVLFKLGVIYQTPYDKLKIIPELVRNIIEKLDDVTFDRGHFATYGDFSLNFEFVYYVNGSDYNKYMDIQQSINLNIFEKFEEQGIEFAYPSQTLFVNKVNEEK